MEIRKENDNIVIYSGMNFPDDLEEGWSYYAVAEFEEQPNGSWKKTEEFDLELKDNEKM